MRPKGKLFALVAVFAAIGVVAASGAFTTVSAERTATANVAGDSSALLQLDVVDSTYAEQSSGTLEIDLTGNASGVNLNATTTITDVFKITNQGSQDVAVNITDSGTNDNLVTFYNTTASGTGTGGSLEGSSNATTLTPGGSVLVSVEIDTVGQGLTDGDELIDGFTIYADADQA